jgi:hypothetical protein
MITAASAGEDRRSDSERVLVGVAHVLADGDPRVWRRLIEDHVSDGSGRCRACRIHGVGGPHWPCTLRTVAEAAREIAGRT